ncbi:hypothetical protein T4D_8158 [Trichinella pseudospiralis]|uniref:Uncharacterized protein n=1 Tax=Trichinella pseudospiralis TaxID=6337 RepID=A0A0V1C524_TRIPS|nr:hypothetical protein T4D_8158 [Trichinella pseudospiralis]
MLTKTFFIEINYMKKAVFIEKQSSSSLNCLNEDDEL